MPRALDSQQLTITHSPTQRLDFNNGKLPFPAFDPAQLIAQWTQFLEDYGFQIISDITGIDLTTLQTVLQPLIDGLDLVTDALSALTSGDPTQLLAFFTELGSLDLLNAFPQILGAFDGIDLSDPGAILAAIAHALEDVPLLGPFVAAITGSSGDLTDLTSWFTDLMGIFGNPTGMGTGSPALGSLGSIPILGPIFGLFGASNATQAGNVFTNLFGLFSNPSLTTAPGSFNPATALFTGPVTEIRSLINSLTGGTTNPLSSLISNLLGTASTASTASTTSSTNASNITSLITNLFGGGSILSQVQPGAVGGVTTGSSLLTDVQTFLNNIFGGITRNTNTSTTQADALDAVSGQANTVVSTAATMEQILAALGSGTPDSDDFERTSSSNLGANWNLQQTGTGVLATPNGHDASSTGTGSSYEFTARKTDKVASTNHQTATIVLASAFPSYKLFTPFPYGGYIDVWVRMSAFTTFATRTGLRFRINGNPPYQATWTIDWVSSGTVTTLSSGTLASIPGAGASISFEVGVGGNTLAYQARINGSPVANFTDSTNKGLGNTGRGFGGKGNSGVGTNQGVPSVQQWTAQG